MLTLSVGYYKESLASRPSQGSIQRAGKVMGFMVVSNHVGRELPRH